MGSGERVQPEAVGYNFPSCVFIDFVSCVYVFVCLCLVCMYLYVSCAFCCFSFWFICFLLAYFSKERKKTGIGSGNHLGGVGEN